MPHLRQDPWPSRSSTKRWWISSAGTTPPAPRVTRTSPTICSAGIPGRSQVYFFKAGTGGIKAQQLAESQ